MAAIARGVDPYLEESKDLIAGKLILEMSNFFAFPERSSNGRGGI